MAGINTTILREQRERRARAFNRSFARSRRSLTNLSNKGVGRVIDLVRDLKEEIRDRLRFAAPLDRRAPFLVSILPGVSEAINRAIESFSQRANRAIAASMEDAFEVGQGVSAFALRAAGAPVTVPIVTPEILAILSREAADIFSETSANLAALINQQISISATGLQPASGAIRRIERFLKTSPEFRRGLRRRIGFTFQAEETARTEIGRVYSAAQQAASEQITDTIPDLRKRWLTVGGGRVRRGHAETQNRYAPGGEVGPIPVRSRFRVDDFSRTGRSTFLTLGGRIRPPGFTGGQRVIKTDAFTRQGSLITDNMLHPREAGASAGNVVS